MDLSYIDLLFPISIGLLALGRIQRNRSDRKYKEMLAKEQEQRDIQYDPERYGPRIAKMWDNLEQKALPHQQVRQPPTYWPGEE